MVLRMEVLRMVLLLWMLWTELDGQLLTCHEPFPDGLPQLVVSPSSTGEKTQNDT